MGLCRANSVMKKGFHEMGISGELCFVFCALMSGITLFVFTGISRAAKAMVLIEPMV